MPLVGQVCKAERRFVGVLTSVCCSPAPRSPPLIESNEMQVFGVFDKLLSYSARAESAQRLGEEIN